MMTPEITNEAEAFFHARPWAPLWTDAQQERARDREGTVLRRFTTAVRHHPERVQLSAEGADWTAAWLDTTARALARALVERGMAPGDRIGVMLQNSSEFVVSVLAAWRAGLVIVPLNPMYRERELRHILLDSGARAIVILGELVPHLEEVLPECPLETIIAVGPRRGDAAALDFARLVEEASVQGGPHAPDTDPDPEMTAFLCYTSGTTGPSKGAMLSHRNVLAASALYAAFQDLGPEDVNFAIAPLFHVTGLLAGITTSLITGMRLVLGGRFDSGVALRLIREYGVTFTVGPTTVFRALLGHEDFRADRFSTVAKIICGGAPIPRAFAEEFAQRTGHRLCNGYGLTEASGPAFGTPRSQASPVHPVSGVLALGVPAPDTECVLLDDEGRPVAPHEPGEICVRGPQVMQGYWRQEEETALAMRDGWLRTGDIATVDDDGWFYLVDRKKDQINASGFKVWPQEVEEVLLSHPAVREAAVFGVPDPYRGETVRAVVVVSSPLSEAELRTHCRAVLAAYKCPTRIEFREDLPKSTAGKVLKRLLRGDGAE